MLIDITTDGGRHQRKRGRVCFSGCLLDDANACRLLEIASERVDLDLDRSLADDDARAADAGIVGMRRACVCCETGGNCEQNERARHFYRGLGRETRRPRTLQKRGRGATHLGPHYDAGGRFIHRPRDS